MKPYPLRVAGICLALLAGMSLCSCSGGGLTCEKACDRLVECDLEITMEVCMQDCSEIKGVIKASAWNDLGDCIMETDCSVLSPEVCLDQVIANAPTGGLDNYINEMCNKVVSCEPEVTHQQCVTEAQQSIGSDAAIINVLKDSILRCISDCIARLECSELETGAEMCLESCGLNK